SCTHPPPPISTLFPSTTLFRSVLEPVEGQDLLVLRPDPPNEPDRVDRKDHSAPDREQARKDRCDEGSPAVVSCGRSPGAFLAIIGRSELSKRREQSRLENLQLTDDRILGGRAPPAAGRSARN